MKKLISLITALVLIMSIGANTLAAGDFETASQAVSHISAGWNLGNTLDCYGTWITGTTPDAFETAWGNPTTTAAMIASVKAQGFNAIRIPVTWAQNIDDTGNVNDAWMARVKEVVDMAIGEGMYVILNVHHDTNGDVKWIVASNDNYNSNHDKFANLWTQIACEFADYDDHLLFEGYNEILDQGVTWNAPNASDAYEATNSYAQLFVDTVRATGGNNSERNLIVNTYVCSVDQAVLNNFTLPSDTVADHLITEVHVYAPWSFTGTSQSVTWTSVHNDFNDSDRAEIDGVMSALESFSQSIGAPVIIGEWGAEYKNNDDQRAAYAGYFTSAAASHGIKCFWWDNGEWKTGSDEGGYAIFDRSSLSWRTDIVSAIIDNTSYTEDDAPDETEPSQTEETTAATETTETQTTEETTLATTAEEEPAGTEVSETTSLTDVTAEQQAQNSDEKSKKSPAVYIVIGVMIVLGAYAGLFALGRYHRKKNRS